MLRRSTRTGALARVLTSPPPNQSSSSGWKDISDFGWSVDAGEVEISQPQSYPFTVLAVVRRVTANSG